MFCVLKFHLFPVVVVVVVVFLGRDWPKKCYSLSNVVGCYCRDTLLTTINELGVYEGVRKIVNEESVVCGDFATAYALGKSLEIAASFSVVIVNTILKSVLISEYFDLFDIFPPPFPILWGKKHRNHL